MRVQFQPKSLVIRNKIHISIESVWSILFEWQRLHTREQLSAGLTNDTQLLERGRYQALMKQIQKSADIPTLTYQLLATFPTWQKSPFLNDIGFGNFSNNSRRLKNISGFLLSVYTICTVCYVSKKLVYLYHGYVCLISQST